MMPNTEDLIRRAEAWIARLRPSDLGANGPMYAQQLIDALKRARAMPTEAEIAAYRDTFRSELDKRMQLASRSSSPSTESHQVALRAFVAKRNLA